MFFFGFRTICLSLLFVSRGSDGMEMAHCGNAQSCGPRNEVLGAVRADMGVLYPGRVFSCHQCLTRQKMYGQNELMMEINGLLAVPNTADRGLT